MAAGIRAGQAANGLSWSLNMVHPIPILLYHSVWEAPLPGFRQWTVHPARFQEHMDHLARNGYSPLTVTQFVTHRANPGALPPRPVVITFDDGLADFYTCALPILRRYHFPATLYITAGFVGKTSRWLVQEGMAGTPMLRWDQAREIAESGIECGAHSFSHPHLDLLSATTLRQEVFGAKEELETHLHRPVSTFAYPHGYYNETVRRLVQEAGFTSACAVKHAMSAVGDDPFALARIIVSWNTSVEMLDRLLTGHMLRVAPTGERLRTKLWRRIRAWRHARQRQMRGTVES